MLPSPYVTPPCLSRATPAPEESGRVQRGDQARPVAERPQRRPRRRAARRPHGRLAAGTGWCQEGGALGSGCLARVRFAAALALVVPIAASPFVEPHRSS